MYGGVGGWMPLTTRPRHLLHSTYYVVDLSFSFISIPNKAINQGTKGSIFFSWHNQVSFQNKWAMYLLRFPICLVESRWAFSFFAQKVIGHVGRIVDELSLLAGLSIVIQVHGIISTRGVIRKLGVMSKKQGRIHGHPSRVLVGTPLKTHRFLYQASNLHHRDHQFIEVVSLTCSGVGQENGQGRQAPICVRLKTVSNSLYNCFYSDLSF